MAPWHHEERRRCRARACVKTCCASLPVFACCRSVASATSRATPCLRRRPRARGCVATAAAAAAALSAAGSIAAKAATATATRGMKRR
eukprot:1540669-Pleurochrysis_carterae.AAC.1